MAYLHPEAALTRVHRSTAGAPVAGTDEVQTITIGGTPTGGTFKLRYKGQTTAAITWTSVDATLVGNIDTALGALSTIGAATNVTVADVTLTSGIGDASITFVAALAKKLVPLITVADNSLTGTAPTVAVTETTPGVSASHRGAPIGSHLHRLDTGILHVNTGTASAPTWTVQS